MTEMPRESDKGEKAEDSRPGKSDLDASRALWQLADAQALEKVIKERIRLSKIRELRKPQKPPQPPKRDESDP